MGGCVRSGLSSRDCNSSQVACKSCWVGKGDHLRHRTDGNEQTEGASSGDGDKTMRIVVSIMS
jgi:hypothetical protein